MTAASHTRLNVEELFLQWKQFLENGSLTTASVIAAAQPDQIPLLQERINDHLAELAGTLDATLSRAFDDPEATVTDSPTKSKLPPKPPDIPGYTFIKLLGHGGMGDVWHVKDPLDREYALKLAHADRLSFPRPPRCCPRRAPPPPLPATRQ